MNPPLNTHWVDVLSQAAYDKKAVNSTVKVNLEVKKYLSTIGRKGGLKSRRRLSSETARQMVLVREAQTAFRNFYSRCFWSFDPNYKEERWSRSL
jgi:hypothetical protein